MNIQRKNWVKKRITAKDVANYLLRMEYFIDEADGMTNRRLQKLLYISQGLYLALKNKPLFKEEIRAYHNCPMVDRCWKFYDKKEEEGNGLVPVSYVQDFRYIFTKGQREHLDEVLTVYGQFSSWKLSDYINGKENPYRNNLGRLGNKVANIIPRKEMKEYFKKYLIEE